MFRKRLLLFILILILLTLPVSADILWEPDNSYYSDTENLDYMDHIYVVPEGATTNMYKSPTYGIKTATLEAGMSIYIGPYGEINGETWGVGYVLGDWDTEGWVRLDRLQRKYEHEDFYNDFGDLCVATDDQLTQLDFDEEVHTWTYPGSGELDRTIPKDALGGGYNDGVMDFLYVYTDPDGGRWGYVGYFMGRCGWVYLDDPETLDAPVFPQTPENTVTDTAPEKNPVPTVLLLVLLTAALSAGTTILILRLKKKRRT